MVYHVLRLFKAELEVTHFGVGWSCLAGRYRLGGGGTVHVVNP